MLSLAGPGSEQCVLDHVVMEKMEAHQREERKIT